MSTKKITTAAVSAAIIFIVTAVVAIPLPIGGGGAYLNLGDSVIYLVSAVLGGPLGAISAAIGSCLADIVRGSMTYALPTFIIKGLMGLVFGLIIKKNNSLLRYSVAAVICGLIMTLGYGIYELAMFGVEYAALSVPLNLIQLAGSAVVAVVLYKIPYKLKLGPHLG